MLCLVVMVYQYLVFDVFIFLFLSIHSAVVFSRCALRVS